MAGKRPLYRQDQPYSIGFLPIAGIGTRYALFGELARLTLRFMPLNNFVAVLGKHRITVHISAHQNDSEAGRGAPRERRVPGKDHHE